MKKLICLFFTVFCVSLSGCGNQKKDIVVEVQKEENAGNGIVEKEEISVDETKVPKEEVTEIEEGFSFAEFKNVNFTFLSGAGGWSTEMAIAEDGTFSGVYHDSEMGSASESYPNGTYYYCSFRGKFAEPVKKDEFVYATTIETISYDNVPGTEEIKDGIRYIYSNAYGLDNPKEILIYLPGMPLEELPEGYFSWVRGNWRMDYEFALTETTLPFYGLYNVSEEQGFSGYDIVEELKQSFTYREEAAATLENSIMQDPLTQLELNEKAQQMYEIWDLTLNEIWGILKRNLDADNMAILTKAQLEWIGMKEQSMKEAGAEVEGGSMYGMVVSLEGARLTKDRVYELMEIVNEIDEK